MPIHRKFGSETSLNSLYILEELRREELISVEGKDRFITIRPICFPVETESSLECSEAGWIPSFNDAIEKRLQELMNPPIPDSLPPTTPSRRRTTEPTLTQTHFPERDDCTAIITRRVRKKHPEKTLKEKWVKTCFFL